MDSLQQASVISSALLILYAFYRRWTRVSISHIQGPSAESWLLGNMGQYSRSPAGTMDFKWQDEYGGVVHIKGIMGEDKLLISDPKALQYIFNSGYAFSRGKARMEISRAAIGRGLLYADHDDHRRQRKVNTPAFGFPETKSYLPIYARYANMLIESWKAEVGSKGSAIIDLPPWVSRATLDVIGETAFDYHFGAMEEGSNNHMKNMYTKAVSGSMKSATDIGTFIQGLLDHTPVFIASLFVKYAPFLEIQRQLFSTSIKVAKRLVEDKSEALLDGQSKRDIMSLLVKANASENERSNLTEEEMLSQMLTIMAAGHETTSNSLSWTFYELARHPDIQNCLRKEIRKGFEALHKRGETVLSTADFDRMEYFTAFTKEAFRYYPVISHVDRVSNKDQVVPLSKPVVTKTGETIEALPIPQGLNVILSISGFNRNKDVFGEDAHEFKPERWLHGSIDKRGAALGVYSNLATFGGGVRSCIGWRFALLEFQTFVAEIVNQLQFEFGEFGEKQIRKHGNTPMVPVIEGEPLNGSHLPLKISLAPSDGE